MRRDTISSFLRLRFFSEIVIWDLVDSLFPCVSHRTREQRELSALLAFTFAENTLFLFRGGGFFSSFLRKSSCLTDKPFPCCLGCGRRIFFNDSFLLFPKRHEIQKEIMKMSCLKQSLSALIELPLKEQFSRKFKPQLRRCCFVCSRSWQILFFEGEGMEISILRKYLQKTFRTFETPFFETFICVFW